MKPTQNPFERYWHLGYRRLVPIIPPDATISEHSTLYRRVGTQQDGRGKTPGVRGQDGAWRGFDWVPYEADERDLRRWHAMGAGIGIKTGQGLIALDADTLNEQHARTIRDAIEAALGRLPIRVGNYPKALYLCRTDGPFQYQRIEFGERDARGRLLDRLEVLSDGRQFVANGIHPKTKRPYEWPRDLPPLDQLPIVKPEQITALLNHLRPLLPQASEIVREGATTDINQRALRGPLEAVRKAVAAIPNTSALFPSRESYRDMGYAIKAALPDDEREAFEIFSDWCQRWTDGDNDPGVVEADWRRMKPPYRRGAGWLYELAEQHGGGNFSAAEAWFEDLDNPENPFTQIELNALKTEADDVYRVLDVAEIVDRPPPRWLLARHIPIVGVGFLYSEPGSGKTFIALDVALHIAAGLKEWNGDALDVADDAIVLYIAAEGSYGFRNRIRAWAKHRKVDYRNLSKRFKMIEQTIDFMAAEDVKKLLRTVRRLAAGRPCLVVVDTVSRAMPGADENLQKEMTLFVRACDAVRDAFSCAVLGVHHAGKSGDMRGSTVLLGAGDFVFRLTRKKGATIGHIECEKQKDGPDGWAEPYRFETVGLEDGESSLVVDRADMVLGPDRELTPDASAAVLRAMVAAWESGEPWSRAPQAKERWAVRRMIADHGFSAEAAEETLRLWERSGLIVTETASAKHRRVGYKVAVNPGQLVQNDDIFG